MKAVMYSKEKEFVVVGEKSLPIPDPGEVLVRIKAAALNHRELKMISYFNKQLMSNSIVEEPKYIFGSDGAGVIVKTGENTGTWQVDDEVIIDSTLTCGECEGCKGNGICKSLSVIGGNEFDGTFAEYIRVPIKSLLKKPTYLNFEEAAALSMGLGTAWRSLISKGNLQKGETVLIHGIGGGVALFALQIAVKLEAKVIVTSSSDEKLNVAREIGAQKGINYSSNSVVEEIISFTNGRGVDLIIDGIGGSTFKTNIEVTAKNARIVNFGFTNSNVATLKLDDLYQFYAKELKFIEGMVHINKDEINSALQFWNENKLHPFISHTYKLDEIEKAYEILKNQKQLGKIIVTMDN